MSIYRNVVWFAKGFKEYTKGGYESACKSFNATDLEVDCSSKSYMVTGGNSGIGKSMAEEIAKRGGTVHLVCRNPKSAEEVKKEIVDSTGNSKIHVHQLDMANPAMVAKFCQQFVEEQNQLNVLINNAGCMINTRETDANNLELNFATNVLGTHILTTNLIPLLSKSDEPRVIIVTSGGMLTQKLDITDLQFAKMKPFDGTMAYAQNKRQQVVMTQQYARLYPSIHFSSMHPGWADTPAVRSSMPDFYEKMKDRLRTAQQGADTAVWLAISKVALQQPSGLFYQDRCPASIHLPLAWTKSSPKEEEQLMTQLDTMAAQFSS